MMEQKNIKTYEKRIISLGMYVPLPVNLFLLLNPTQICILCLLRHCANIGQHFVSFSMMKLMTNLSEKTIRKAIRELEEKGFIEKGKIVKDGTHYDICYKKIYESIKQLNGKRDPFSRSELAIKILRYEE